MEVADLTELIIIISLSLLIFMTVLVIVFLKPILKFLRKYIFSRFNFSKITVWFVILVYKLISNIIFTFRHFRVF